MSQAANLIQLDADGTLLSEVSCRKCGYLLRGIKTDGNCPECNLPVSESTRSDYFRDSDVPWLKILLLRCVLIIIGALAWAGMIAIAMFASGPDAISAASAPFWLAIAVLTVLGYWFVTMPEPHRFPFRKREIPRKIVRVMACVYLVAATLMAILAMLSDGYLWIGVIGYVPMLAIIAVWSTATVLYFRHLALKFPARILSRCLACLSPLFPLAMGWMIAMAFGLISDNHGFLLLCFASCWVTWFALLLIFTAKLILVLRQARSRTNPASDPSVEMGSDLRAIATAND